MPNSPIKASQDSGKATQSLQKFQVFYDAHVALIDNPLQLSLIRVGRNVLGGFADAVLGAATLSP
jgi:hypothetical protein